MSSDAHVTKDLIQTLKDGQDGFSRAAERLDDSDRADLAGQFREFAAERGRFADELATLAAEYGDHVEQDGSVAAALHRGWMTIKDAISGSDAKGVLDAAEQGEDHAVSEFTKALERDDLSAGLRTVVQRQYDAVKRAHDTVKSLRDQAAD